MPRPNIISWIQGWSFGRACIIALIALGGIYHFETRHRDEMGWAEFVRRNPSVVGCRARRSGESIANCEIRWARYAREDAVEDAGRLRRISGAIGLSTMVLAWIWLGGASRRNDLGGPHRDNLPFKQTAVPAPVFQGTEPRNYDPTAADTADDEFSNGERAGPAASGEDRSGTVFPGEVIQHPWRRFFARLTDYWLLGTVIGLASGALGAVIPGWFTIALESPLTGGVLIATTFIPFEAFFLSQWGATPGKALLGIRVADRGRTLTLARSMTRATNVWFQGLAFGLPVVSWIMAAGEFQNLKRSASTSYDSSHGFTVAYEPLRRAYVIALVLLWMGFAALGIIGLASVIGR